LNIAVEVNAGNVVLSGTVPDKRAWYKADWIVKTTPEVGTFRNELQVEPLNMDGSRTADVPPGDSLLGTRVLEALMSSSYLCEHDLSISVNNGRVTLYGHVNANYKRWIVAQRIDAAAGVTRIDDYLLVMDGRRALARTLFDSPTGTLANENSGPRPDMFSDRQHAKDIADGSMEALISSKLNQSRKVRNKFVRVEVRDGVAILNGLVGTESERDAATDAAHQGGARIVQNNISVPDGVLLLPVIPDKPGYKPDPVPISVGSR
jgi:osmotically-inducible protein OsmY